MEDFGNKLYRVEEYVYLEMELVLLYVFQKIPIMQEVIIQ
jgi:hypothetical protein